MKRNAPACSACDSPALPGRRWCASHAPRFLGARPARFPTDELQHILWAQPVTAWDLEPDHEGIASPAFASAVRAAFERIVGASPMRLDLRADRR